ncbi:hypothetical protein [Zhongshania sp.]|uniref:hypothetical protein n=1 Tax=Zhongshania sp. TaxID=1971902 RepID=UPI0035653266
MTTRRPLVILDDSTISELPLEDDLPSSGSDLRLNFSYSENVTPPAFGALVTVPSGTTEREVYFSIAMDSGALTSSSVTVEVETGIGTGLYSQVLRLRQPPGASVRTLSGAFVAASGRRYRFIEDMTGGTRDFVFYSFRDISAVSDSHVSDAAIHFTLEDVDDRVAGLIQNGTGLSWAYDDVGNSLTGTVSLAPFSTSDLSEGSNLYYTQARFDSAFAAKTTTGLSEGSNLYYTDERVDDRVSALIIAGNQLTKTYDDALGTLTLSVSEGAGSDLDADLLDGQHGAFYQNAANLNAGVLPAARFNDTAHGSRSGGSLHSLATTGAHGFMSSSDKSKLDGVEPGATADQTAADIRALGFFDATNDGALSGLDSDLLDGQHGAYYLDWTNVTNKPDPTLTLNGDVSGSATFTDLGSATMTVSVADDSHNHIIGNVDGLQAALDGKAASGHTHDDRYYTESEADGRFTRVSSGLTSNLDTFYDADFFGWNNTTVGRPEDFGQGIAIVSSGKTYNQASNWITQLAFGTSESGSYFRTRVNAGAWSAWRKLWNDANDGSGSGLDADLLDGQHGSFYQNAGNLNAGILPSARLSGSYGISISGNAATATTLQTARTINGTSFNGGANITTASWGTSRTLTIGSTGKAVNGSGNVSWSLAEIGALGVGAKAADSNLLDGLDSTAFALAGHNHDASYLGINAKAADSNLLDGIDSSQFLRRDLANQNHRWDRNFSGQSGTANTLNGSDHAGLGSLNNLSLGTWFGFSIHPTISGQVVAQNTPAFSVNARNGNVEAKGKGVIQASVNFDGSNASVRSSHNVSSVVRNAAGKYTVNFNAGVFADTSYAGTASSGSSYDFFMLSAAIPVSATACQIGSFGADGPHTDTAFVNAIFCK